MTDQLEAVSIFNESEFLEDEADKFNDLTFGDEIPWDFENTNLDAFQFDGDQDSSQNQEKYQLIENPEIKESSNSRDLLGLSGSFFNQGLFKFESQNDSKDYVPTDEFEIAIQNLDLLDKGIKSQEKMQLKEKSQQPALNERSISDLDYSTRYSEIQKYSEFLFEKFRMIPKVNNNIVVLNQLVASHLTCLTNTAQQLNISHESLLQLRYFRILKNFCSIERNLHEINTKNVNVPLQKNVEIAAIIQDFSMQPVVLQSELGITHPFYANLISLISQQSQNQQRLQINQTRAKDNIPEWALDSDKRAMADQIKRNKIFESSEGGWMSGSERDWLKKIQTKNLATENPYIQDYYYTKLKLNNLTATRNKQIAELGYSNLTDPNMLLPSPISSDQLSAGIDPNKDQLLPSYKPMQFENSLGVLSASNLNTPRQIIQIPSKSEMRVKINNTNDQYHIIREQRELLGLIEKMYSIILRIDEIDKSLARVLVSQHKNSIILMQHRNYLLKLLMETVERDNKNFIALFSVSKGARIFLSLIAIVNSQQFITLMRLMFFNCLSLYDSNCFTEVVHDLQTIIISRLKVLKRDDLSMLITAFFCDLKSVEENVKLKPLSGFCKQEFGLTVAFTVMECFLQNCPEDKLHVDQLLVLMVRSVESSDVLNSCMKNFAHLFSNQTNSNNHITSSSSS